MSLHKTETTKIEKTNIRKLFIGRVFEIPIYQRGYAWERPEVEQLVQDILDSMNDKRSHYYIGNVVTYRLPRDKNDKPVLQVIDGQQRLTTIYLLLCALKKLGKLWPSQDKQPQLTFESRTKSSDILSSLWEGECNEYDSALVNAFSILVTCLNRMAKANQLNAFTDYLETHVMVLISEVPSDTDLNHYFEIMNSRGEQLEQHEIIKAHCLDKLKADHLKQKAFGMIWDTASDMRRYVQYGFATKIRKQLFGDTLSSLTAESGNAFYQLFDGTEGGQAKGYTGESDSFIIGPESCLNTIDGFDLDASSKTSDTEDEAPERFYSVIDFENFLLHVLKIFVYKKYKIENVTLDDKKFIQIFRHYLHDEDDVSDFGEFLLRARYMFDCYVIKREWLREKESWSMKRLHLTREGNVSYKSSFPDSDTTNSKDGDCETSDDKNALVKIQSMFHVSFPSMTYKYWLNGILKWLLIDMNGAEIDGKGFLTYLENMAAAFMFDRYCSNTPLDFDTIIYKNTSKPVCDTSKIDFPNKLNRGTDVELFVFNYLDYLLWEAKMKQVYTFYPDENIDSKLRYDSRIDNFEFVSRSSVEHYYPQKPLSGDKLPADKLNSFGNLCLISRSKNARLSNFLPEAKKEHYDKADHLDSIKQRIMMAYPTWGAKEIEEHQKTMFSLLEATMEDMKAENQFQV